MLQPLLWALVGAATAGGLFFLLDQPRNVGISISLSTPVPVADAPAALSLDTTPAPQQYLIDINTASAELLDTLPNIGGKRAADIVAYRERYGLFQRTDELMKVPGIGSVIYQGLKDLITVGNIP